MDIIERYVNHLIYVKEDYKKAYLYIWANISRSAELRYELARFYEEGIYIKQDLLYAYFLYISAKGIKDSNEKIKKLKPIVIEPYSKSIDEVLDVELEDERIRLEEKKIKDEKTRIEVENKLAEEQEEKLRQKKYRDKLVGIFKEVKLLKDDLEPKNDIEYKKSKSYRKMYDEALGYYDRALREESASVRLRLVEQAAEIGHTYAMMALYELYKEIDDEKAINYLIEAAKVNQDAKKKYNEVKEERKIKLENLIKELKEDSIKLK